jgi:hypothetical protein
MRFSHLSQRQHVSQKSGQRSAITFHLKPPQALNSTMPGAGPQNTSEPDDHRTVRCLLETENDTFKVHVSRDVDVEDLKDAIWEKGIRDSTVLANDLILYQVGLVQCPRQTNCCSLGDIPTGRSQPG